MQKILHKYIGDKKFYKHTLAIAVPIMVQNGITNFVSLLDNIMVGRIGTEQMSGVSIVNQLIMIYYLCIFGGMAGAGIFTAQYYGENNDEGIRNTIRFKLLIGIILTVLAFAVFILFGDTLVRTYLTGNSDGGNILAALDSGIKYLKIMIWGLPPFMLLQVYTSSLRECNETVAPMKAGIIAVLVNLIFNYLLIYGKFGFPKLGVQGAAIATVLSRYVEAFVVVCWAHMHKEKNPYIKGLYRKIFIPLGMFKKFTLKSLPLLTNEAMWSGGTAIIAQCYSVRGLSVVAGLNIANTVFNVFSIVFIALGNAISIMVGQLLGAGKMEQARDTDNKLIAFSVISCAFIGVILMLVSPLFPELYNTTKQAKLVAEHFLIAQAIFMPQLAFVHATYFTLRSGGKTIITFVFDSVYMWVISVPTAFILSRYTSISAVYIYVLVQMADWIKCILGFILVKKGVWIKNIIKNE